MRIRTGPPQTPEPDGVPVRIRHTLEPGDLGAVVRLHGSVYARECGWGLRFEAYVAEGVGRMGASFDQARDRVWIAERADRVVGSIAIVGHPDGGAQLRYFVVDHDARGLGLGRRLLDEALAFCTECGYSSIFLLTARGLDVAAHLYRQAGFTLVEEQPFDAWSADTVMQTYRLERSP